MKILAQIGKRTFIRIKAKRVKQTKQAWSDQRAQFLNRFSLRETRLIYERCTSFDFRFPLPFWASDAASKIFSLVHSSS